MAVVEDVTGDDNASGDDHNASTKAELLATLWQLSKRLALPEELLPSFMNEEKPVEAVDFYRDHAINLLRQILPKARTSSWTELSTEDQADVMLDVLRLYGHDPWTSPTIRDIIDEITSTLPSPSSLAFHLLTHPLRTLFSPTPSPLLSTTTSRALSRPAGGPDAHTDFQDSSTQRYKSPSGWGCYNVLLWCCSHLYSTELEKHVGVVLPPTLVMMDDWEPPWRGRGVRVLEAWMEKVPSETMRRMGIDKLLLNSLVHTLSLHANPPLPHVLPLTLRLVERSTVGAGRAERYAGIMDKAIIQGWTYAPSGKEGRVVLIDIARELELLCSVQGTGIARWLKTIVPNLLDPLQYSPSPVVLPHYRANLSALLCLMRTLRQTARITRWRGQILDVLSRLWLQLQERGSEDESKDSADLTWQVQSLVLDIFTELQHQYPSVSENEYNTLLKLDHPAFRKLIPNQVNQ